MGTDKSFAQKIAQTFQGRVKRDEFELEGVPRSELRVDGTYRGRTLRFWVFEDRCLVEGSTTMKLPLAVSYNSIFAPIDKRVTNTLPAGAMPVYRARVLKGGKEIVPDTLPTLRSNLRVLWDDDETRHQLLALQLRAGEFLALTKRPLFSDGPPSFYFLHRSRDLERLERRLDTLFKMLPAVPSEAIQARRVSDTAYRIKLDRQGSRRSATEPRHRFGGSLADAPKCPNCRTAVHLILEIDTKDPKLRRGPLGRRLFPVLYCLNCMSWGTLYVDYAGKKLRIVRQDKADKVNADDPLEERPVSLTKLASPKTSASKIGGSPVWLQGTAVPECVRCDKPMSFFGQLKSLPTLGFGDDGVLYAFVCVDCNVSASLIQSR
jgi:hypothetical protein